MLFSEPKIPQSQANRRCAPTGEVSVLFSEPKIPQCMCLTAGASCALRFSALQRAENSSIPAVYGDSGIVAEFQCSSASRKFLNWRRGGYRVAGEQVSVLFSEPKIPQCERSVACPPFVVYGFSALQRAENSSIPTLAPASIHISDRDDHASSFLSLPGASP